MNVAKPCFEAFAVVAVRVRTVADFAHGVPLQDVAGERDLVEPGGAEEAREGAVFERAVPRWQALVGDAVDVLGAGAG